MDALIAKKKQEERNKKKETRRKKQEERDEECGMRNVGCGVAFSSRNLVTTDPVLFPQKIWVLCFITKERCLPPNLSGIY
jgi:hypothetical protein